MTKIALYFFSIFLLLFTVPWFYSSINMQSVFGFPIWAFYSLVATFIYAIIIALFLHKYWAISAKENHLKE